MKQYIQFLRNLLSSVNISSLNTTHISTYAVSMKFDVSKSIPMLPGMDEVCNNLVEYVLWMISGNSDTSVLSEYNRNKWSNLVPTEDFIRNNLDDVFAEIQAYDNLDRADVLEYMLQYKGHIGKMLGYLWRFMPVSDASISRLRRNDIVVKIASDKLQAYQDDFNVLQPRNDDGSSMSVEHFCKMVDAGTLDQLQNLILSIKNNPDVSVLHVQCFSPEFSPLDGMSPQKSVLMGGAATVPLVTSFSCYIMNMADNEKRIDMNLSIPNIDVFIPLSTVVAEYSLLLHLLAHVTGSEPGYLSVNIGRAIADIDDFSAINGLIRSHDNNPVVFDTYSKADIVINKEATDLFKMTKDDIKLQLLQCTENKFQTMEATDIIH